MLGLEELVLTVCLIKTVGLLQEQHHKKVIIPLIYMADIKWWYTCAALLHIVQHSLFCTQLPLQCRQGLYLHIQMCKQCKEMHWWIVKHPPPKKKKSTNHMLQKDDGHWFTDQLSSPWGTSSFSIQQCQIRHKPQESANLLFGMCISLQDWLTPHLPVPNLQLLQTKYWNHTLKVSHITFS